MHFSVQRETKTLNHNSLKIARHVRTPKNAYKTFPGGKKTMFYSQQK